MDLLRRWVLHNLPLKLLALASAVLLWSAVAEEPRTEIAHTVPIEFINVPAGMPVVADKAEVQIWLSGPRRMVREIAPGDLHPVIDLGGLSRNSRERDYRLSPAQIWAPAGVDVVEVVPAEFRLSVDTNTVHVAVAGAKPGGAVNPK